MDQGSPKVNRSGKERTARKPQVSLSISNDIHDALPQPVSITRAMSVNDDMSTIRHSRHDATGNDMLSTGHSSHKIMHKIVVSNNNGDARRNRNDDDAKSRNSASKSYSKPGRISSRHSVRSSRHSIVSAVTSKLGSMALGDALREDEEELEREMEAKQLELDAEGLEKRAKIMRKHSQLIKEASKAGGSLRSKGDYLISVESDIEDDDSITADALPNTYVRGQQHEMEDRMRAYLDECHRQQVAEQMRSPPAMTAGQHNLYGPANPRWPVQQITDPRLNVPVITTRQEPGPNHHNELDHGDRADLPRVELPKYDGNPTRYWNFINQFEVHIEAQTRDPKRRLLHLLNYCVGPAYNAINDCAALPPNEGYEEARTTLQRLFGQPHMVSRGLIDEVLCFPNIRQNDGAALTQLFIKMAACLRTLRRMNYMADLDAITTLQTVLSKLPGDIKSKWLSRAMDIYDQGREPNFEDLTQFVNREAATFQTRFAIGFNEQGPQKGTQGQAPRVDNRWRIGPANPDSRWAPGRNPQANHLDRAVDQRLASPLQYNQTRVVHHLDNAVSSRLRKKDCLVCKAAHKTEQCKVYLDMSVSEKWELVKANGGCFSCLEMEHSIKACRSSKPCGVNQCSRKHHPTLHRDMQIEPSKVVLYSTRDSDQFVSLGVIPVVISGPQGTTTICALLDTGANTTLIRKGVVDAVGIIGSQTEITVNTLAGSTTLKASKCDFKAQAVDQSDSVNMHGVFAVRSLPMNIQAKVTSDQFKNWPHLAGMPVTRLDGCPVDMIIGCDQPKAHWVQEVRLGKELQPFGMRTPLGWIVLGPTQQEGGKSVYHMCTSVIKERVANRTKRNEVTNLRTRKSHRANEHISRCNKIIQCAEDNTRCTAVMDVGTGHDDEQVEAVNLHTDSSTRGIEAVNQFTEDSDRVVEVINSGNEDSRRCNEANDHCYADSIRCTAVMDIGAGNGDERVEVVNLRTDSSISNIETVHQLIGDSDRVEEVINSGTTDGRCHEANNPCSEDSTGCSEAVGRCTTKANGCTVVDDPCSSDREKGANDRLTVSSDSITNVIPCVEGANRVAEDTSTSGEIDNLWAKLSTGARTALTFVRLMV